MYLVRTKSHLDFASRFLPFSLERVMLRRNFLKLLGVTSLTPIVLESSVLESRFVKDSSSITFECSSPQVPNVGDVWFDTLTQNVYVAKSDGFSVYWRELC